MKYRYVLILIIIAGASIFLAYRKMQRMENGSGSERIIRYLPLGDSYTIGTGIEREKNYPTQLVNQLSDQGIKISLVANPARNGFTTQDLMDEELPYLDKTTPDFVTILIGVNDWVRGVDKKVFEKNYEMIIEAVQKKMGDNKNRVLLITIPDFGLTPTGKQFGGGRDISKGIEEFNQVIKAKAEKYNLQVADIYPVSKDVVNDPSLTAEDGLHPSAKGYGEWLRVIAPIAKAIILK
jgi:acyl-CoA thioesterase I